MPETIQATEGDHMVAKSTLLGLLATITLLLPCTVQAGVTDTQQLGAPG